MDFAAQNLRLGACHLEASKVGGRGQKLEGCRVQGGPSADWVADKQLKISYHSMRI